MKYSYLVILWLLFFILLACDKKNEQLNNQNADACVINTEIENDSIIRTYYYDSLNRISKYSEIVSSDTNWIAYRYYPPNFVRVTSKSSLLPTKGFNINSIGLADTTSNLMGDLINVNVNYRYNLKMQIIEKRVSGKAFLNNIDQLEEYKYDGNNRIQSIFYDMGKIVDTITYEYDLTKVDNLASLGSKKDFVKFNENVVVKENWSHGDNYTYSYNYDSNNKIIKKTTLKNNLINKTLTYSWQCK
jgi:hypothetical protein